MSKLSGLSLAMAVAASVSIDEKIQSKTPDVYNKLPLTVAQKKRRAKVRQQKISRKQNRRKK